MSIFQYEKIYYYSLLLWITYIHIFYGLAQCFWTETETSEKALSVLKNRLKPIGLSAGMMYAWT